MSPSARLLRPAVAAAALALLAGGLLAFNWFPRSGDGRPYLWTKGWTTLSINTYSFPSGSVGNQIVRAAAAPWNTNPQSSFRFIIQERYTTTIGHLDGSNDFYLIPLMPYYGLGTLGLTYSIDDTGTWIVYPSSGTELREADVAMDWSYNGYYWYYYDFQSTATHELGHALGLAHVADPTAVMSAYASPLPSTARVLSQDDKDGEAYLYPGTGGGGGGLPPPGPSPKPKRSGSMSGLTVSATDVLVGDPISFDATISNPNDDVLLLSGIETRPATTGPWQETILPPGGSQALHLERTVVDLPGLYDRFLRLGGQDAVMVYEIQQVGEGAPVRVRRPVVPLPVQDNLAAALGPGGTEEVDLLLVKGAKVTLEINIPGDWAGQGRITLTSPTGRPVKFVPGKAMKVKESGFHRLVVENGSGAKGNYRLFTAAEGKHPAAKAKAALPGTGPAEVPFLASARTGGTVSVKGSKKLGLAVTALRSPSGEFLPVTAGPSVAVEEFGEDGTWTAVVEGVEGAAGKFKLQATTAWTEGEPVTR
ncbi:MAG: matrixin family metalloprotease [Planctomycetaceae bacterium]|nr:matrixin family metalloprotease [Planctomycetota bacterium]NUN51818.1 matrixin family metalloprotease [Planctomycetaceae bacterium]